MRSPSVFYTQFSDLSVAGFAAVEGGNCSVFPRRNPLAQTEQQSLEQPQKKHVETKQMQQQDHFRFHNRILRFGDFDQQTYSVLVAQSRGGQKGSAFAPSIAQSV